MIANPRTLPNGPAVASAQRELAALGFDVGTIDGQNGPRTDRAYAAYRDAIPRRGAPLPREVAETAVRYMRSFIGPAEEWGKNRGALPDMLCAWAGKRAPDGAAYCARFVWHGVDVAARAHGYRLAKGQTSGGVKTSWERATVRVTVAEIAAGATVPMGALICRAVRGQHHVEMLDADWLPGQAWAQTIGGNTSSGVADWDGEGVWSHPRFLERDSPYLMGAIVPVLVAG